MKLTDVHDIPTQRGKHVMITPKLRNNYVLLRFVFAGIVLIDLSNGFSPNHLNQCNALPIGTANVNLAVNYES